MLKDPRGWQEFADHLRHPSTGSANTMRGAQGDDQTSTTCAANWRSTNSPLLVICGDEDDQCLELQSVPEARHRHVRPCAPAHVGHLTEEPAQFNRFVQDFVCAVDTGVLDNYGKTPRSSLPESTGTVDPTVR